MEWVVIQQCHTYRTLVEKTYFVIDIPLKVRTFYFLVTNFDQRFVNFIKKQTILVALINI